MSRLAHLFSIVVVALLGTQLAHAERTTTYYHTDSLGSVVAASNQAGALLWRKDYAPFGAQPDSTDEKEKIAYTAKEHDDISRFTYFGARYYDPAIGRFLSIDPAGVDPANPFSFNRYAYANNNPYRFIDPDGRQACDLEECKDYEESTRSVYGRGAKIVREGGSDLSDVVDEEATNAWNWVPFIGGAKKAERAARGASRLLGRAGRSAFGETVFRGLAQNRPLRELSDTQIRAAFRGTPFTPSSHAVSRLLDQRTANLGFGTLNDIAGLLNKGSVQNAGGGLVAIQRNRFEAIVDPATKTKVIVTFRPF